jgi:hypothetical protein
MIRGALSDNAEAPECQMPTANSSFPIKQLPPLIQTFAIHVNKAANQILAWSEIREIV